MTNSYLSRLCGGLLLLLTLSGCIEALRPRVFRFGLARSEIHRELLSHRSSANKKVELFWAKPDGLGPWPAVLFVHGHQEGGRNGGKAFVEVGRLARMVARGYVAGAVSQPGYGTSDGPPDYCGPVTQDAIITALEFLQSQPFVRSERVALYGVSRGAIAGAMVAARHPRLAAVVLVSGAYDFATLYPTGIAGIDDNIRKEAGVSSEAFNVRSALLHAHKIKAPVMLLHGAKDDRIKPDQAEQFAEALKSLGVPVRLKIYSELGHFISPEDQYREIYPFLEQYLR